MNSYLLDALIRDQLADARDRAAKRELIRGIRRPPRLLLFADTPNTPWQARRAALLVDLAAGQGLARGFVEAGQAGEPHATPLDGHGIDR